MRDRKIHILCVNHSESDCKALCQCLKKTKLFKCRLSHAETAQDSLQKLEKYHFDFALIDDGLPGGDGHELARRMRRDYPHTRVLMLVNGDKSEAKARKAGAIDCIRRDEICSTALPRAITCILEMEVIAREERHLKETRAIMHEQLRAIESLKAGRPEHKAAAQIDFSEDSEALKEWTQRYLDVFKSCFEARENFEKKSSVELFTDELFATRIGARDIMEMFLKSLGILFEGELRFTGHQEARIMLLKVLAGLVDRYQGALEEATLWSVQPHDQS